MMVPKRVTPTVATEKSVVRWRGRGCKRLELDRDSSGAARILAGDRLGEEGLIGGEVGEVVRAAQLKRFLDRALEMAMRGFDRAVLMRHAGIVAGRLQTIVAAEGGVALGLVIAVGEVAIGGREPVGAVLARARRRAARAPPAEPSVRAVKLSPP